MPKLAILAAWSRDFMDNSTTYNLLQAPEEHLPVFFESWTK